MMGKDPTQEHWQEDGTVTSFHEKSLKHNFSLSGVLMEQNSSNIFLLEYAIQGNTHVVNRREEINEILEKKCQRI